MVVAEHAAEALLAQNATAQRGGVVRSRDELVAERLMISFGEIVRDVLSEDQAQVMLTQRYDAS
jgi:hypothetical protein